MRGVYKLAIEINDIQNEFFDKAVLFVKSECHSSDKALLDSSAREYLSGLQFSGSTPKPQKKPQKHILWRIARFGGAMVLGAVLTVLLFGI